MSRRLRCPISTFPLPRTEVVAGIAQIRYLLIFDTLYSTESNGPAFY
jgi:hypothetical protein